MTQAMSTEEFLEHYGVKGMKWGVRKERQPLSRKQKAAIVTGGAVVVGAAAAAIVLGSTGRLPTSQIRTAVSAAAKVRGALRATPHAQAAQTIRRIDSGVSAANRLAWDKTVRELEADFDSAHARETSYMLKAVPGYNPRSNEYSREYQRLQIGR